MASDADGGIDKFQVLSAIQAVPPSPAAPPAPSPLRPPSTIRRAIETPSPPWVRHRHEIAALITAFAGVIWLAVGLAKASWWPCFTGILLGVGSLAIWAIEIWGND